ncbi:GNAT family N-acetyltransferase [Microvirga pudoricolor]|uniref:GNAT family N-acetyltransferase n=1 Tax=Microvirga pudoricolor TaxID=2778729 RepID=UPI00194DCA72|nr:GNAT family N-acetyltransferase [Microvirga pudoricolor]MBM6596276.1 GNAT family N-acetyltransferase [Microvirga pudoricolor]
MAREPISLNLNGYTDLPGGKVATIVTYLEMLERPRLKRLPRPTGWRLLRLNGDMARYRRLFARVGEPWLWFSRAVMPDESLAGILRDPGVEAFALHDGREDLGLLELDFRPRGEVELGYFGLVPEAIGQGAGRWLMNEAIRRAFARPVRRFYVHTCTLDSPAALPFYIRSGFKPYRQAIEVADDPRLTGHLPPHAGPHVPILAAARTTGTRRAARPRRGQIGKKASISG